MKRLIISNSMLRTLNTCSTQAWLRTGGYAVEAQEEPFFMAGRAAHEAFALWISGKPAGECVQKFLDEYKEYSDKYIVEGDYKQGRFHHSNLQRILEVFFTSNPVQSMPFEVVAVEEQVVMPLFCEKGVEYCVSDKCDAIVRMLDTGDLFAFENKTAQRIDEHVYDEYDLDSQVSCHVAASRAKGWDVKGCWMQILQFNKLPNPAQVTPKKGEPSKCRTAGHGLVRDCWPKHVKATRFPVERTEADLQVWQGNVQRALYKYRQVLDESWLDLVPQEGLFGRCGWCDYRQFCKGHRQHLSERLVKRKREEGVMYSGFYEG